MALVRGRRGPAGEGGQLEQYVNDRPYGCEFFHERRTGKALHHCNERKEQRASATCGDSDSTCRKRASDCSPWRRGSGAAGCSSPWVRTRHARLPLDEQFPEWGESPYVALRFAATFDLQKLLTHLYVLIPVLDNEKHYWVGEDEIEKLLKRGEGWLGAHPEKELIVSRYLKRQRSLTRAALETAGGGYAARRGNDCNARRRGGGEGRTSARLARTAPGNGAVGYAGVGAKRVLDLGCGEGKLLRLLLGD